MDTAPSLPGTARWFRVVEIAAAGSVFVYLAGSWRTDVLDFLVLGGAAVFGFAFRRRLLPPPRPRRADPRAALVTASFTLVAGAALWVWGIAVRGHAPRPTVVLLTLVLYVPFAGIQQFLTQRYLVLRVAVPLGRGSDLGAAAIGAVLFGLCHVPWPEIQAVTTVAGLFWIWSYLKTGRIWDLALSQAVLATSLFCVAWGFDPVSPLVRRLAW